MEKITAKDIKIETFYQIIDISQSDQPRYEKEIDIIKLVYPNMTEEEIVDQPLEVIDDIIKGINHETIEVIEPVITLNGKEYTLKGDPNDFKLTYGQYKTFEKCMYDNDFRYVHKLMATIYVNEDTTTQRVEDFLQLKMQFVIPFIMLLPATIDKKYK
jgi:hypothetical protein